MSKSMISFANKKSLLVLKKVLIVWKRLV